MQLKMPDYFPPPPIFQKKEAFRYRNTFLRWKGTVFAKIFTHVSTAMKSLTIFQLTFNNVISSYFTELTELSRPGK